MDSKLLIELFGYFGSMLVVVSMLMTSVKKLRIVNTTGSVIFMIYALIIRSYPTALMNFCLVMINIWQLIQLGKKERHFQLIKVSAGEGMMKYLLEHYREDILKYFPDAEAEVSGDCDQAYIVTCDTIPAGLLLGNETKKGTVRIIIDYATPAYRDASVGKYLYRHLMEYDINKLVFSSRSQGHEEYMKEMGFVRSDAGYEKELRGIDRGL